MDFGPGPSSNPAPPPDIVTVISSKHKPYLGRMQAGEFVWRRFCSCARCMLRYLQ